MPRVGERSARQCLQNCAPRRFGLPQFGQVTVDILSSLQCLYNVLTMAQRAGRERTAIPEGAVVFIALRIVHLESCSKHRRHERSQCADHCCRLQ